MRLSQGSSRRPCPTAMPRSCTLHCWTSWSAPTRCVHASEAAFMQPESVCSVELHCKWQYSLMMQSNLDFNSTHLISAHPSSALFTCAFACALACQVDSSLCFPVYICCTAWQCSCILQSALACSARMGTFFCLARPVTDPSAVIVNACMLWTLGRTCKVIRPFLSCAQSTLCMV